MMAISILFQGLSFMARLKQYCLPETNGNHFMRYLTLIFVLLCLPAISQAEKGQSIMFGDQDPLQIERTRDTTADEQAAHCKQLRQRMDELKGRPQSRNAVIRRYRVECEPQYEMPGQPKLQ